MYPYPSDNHISLVMTIFILPGDRHINITLTWHYHLHQYLVIVTSKMRIFITIKAWGREVSTGQSRWLHQLHGHTTEPLYHPTVTL